MTTTVYIVRHSEKMGAAKNMWNVFDRIQPLSGYGEEKAKALLEMECLRNADAVYCSPFARTLSTLRYIMEADGLQPELDEGLKELEFGGEPFFGGMPPSGGQTAPPAGNDIRARQWQDRDLADVNGESLNQCCARMTAAMGDILRDNAGKTILVGSHGASICAYLSSITEGIDDDYTRTLPQPAVFRLTFEGQQPISVQRLTLPEAAR